MPKESDPTEESTSENIIETPARFGRYEVTGFLGRGGFGTVYEGFDEELQRKVAIKVPLLDDDHKVDVERYRIEAQNLAKLRHPGIVSIFDVGLDENGFYIVTEMLEGITLYDYLNNTTPTWEQSAEMIAQVADALAHAHARKVIHRDIKPGNIFLTEDRGPVLVDFGLAIADQNAGDEIGSVRGTLRYMAPEQIEGRAHRIDGRTDIYAVGVVLYQMLTGHVPFRSSSRQELRRQILTDEPQPPRQLDANIPGSLEGACLRAMAKSVSKRFTTAADLTTKLKSIVEEHESSEKDDAAGLKTTDEPLQDHSDSGQPFGSEAVAAPVAGRRHVTVLHLSTTARSTGAELDPEDQMEALRLMHNECQTHIERFGGSPLPSGSQELTVCFGYPLSYEDAPRRAVHTGLAIQQAMSDMSRELEKRLGARLQVWTSIHSGIVLTSGPTTQSLVGDMLTLVTKIDRETDPGDVVVSEDTYQLVHNDFLCDALNVSCRLPSEGSMRLFRVDHIVEQSEETSEVEGIEFTPLVGRNQELNMLLDRWELVGEGYGQLVALIGDAGLGKSRLVQELRQHVHSTSDSQESPIIEWDCSPYHGGSAFHPAKESLAKILRFERDQGDEKKREVLKKHLRDLGLDLAGALPLFCDLLSLPHDPEFPHPSVSSPKLKELTLEYLHQWLSALSRQRPILFIVEDLHWVDPSTLDFLQRIADEPIDDPFLCLLTFRPEFTTPWTSRAHQTQIALNRLTRKQVNQIVESKIERGTVPSGLIDRIADRTDGVPLFVEEYAKMLVESAASMADTVDQMPESTMGSHSVGVLIPATLQGLLMARLDRIGGDSDLVRLAATLGRNFSFELISTASDLDSTLLSEELEKLVESQLLSRRGTPPNCTYMFKHALIQDAAYDSMLRRQRRKMHERIANTLENAFPEEVAENPEVLAHHRSKAGQNIEAVHHWAAAGGMATERGEFVEAVNHLQSGLQNLESAPESTERDQLEYQINVPLGIATLSIRGYAAPELGDIYERRMKLCQKLQDPMGQLHADWAMASWRIVRDEMEESLRIAARMMNMAGEMDDDGALMEALFIQAIAQFYHGEFKASLASCQQGWALHQPERTLFHTSRTGQHAGVAHLAYMALNHWYLGQPASALERMQEALELAESLNHPFSVAFALHHFGWLQAAMRRGNEAIDCAQRQMKVSQEQAFFFWETTGMLFHAGGLVWLDRDQDACEQLSVGLARYNATGAELALPQYFSFQTLARIKLGALDDAEEALDQAFAAAEKSAEFFHEPELWRLRGRLADARGNRDEAIHHAQSSLTTAQRHESPTWELTALLDLAEFTPGTERQALVQHIATSLDKFEPCDIEIPIVAQAKSLLA